MWARTLGAAGGAEAVEDYAHTGGSEYDRESGYTIHGVTCTAEQLREVGEGWDTHAINAGAARIDGCPAGHEDAYYEAYEASAQATIERLATALESEDEAPDSGVPAEILAALPEMIAQEMAS